MSLRISSIDFQAQQFGAAIMDDEVEKNVKEAFDAIHKVGVLHGDIRRQNVMIREDRSVVIIDFEHSIYSDDLSTDRIREENDEIEFMLMEARDEKAAFTKSKAK
jgi:RIO-like serine/threonine protein kinase